MGLGLLVLGVGLTFFLFNPDEGSFFPRCPFNVLTGWLCPGCGSQRAVHHLLNGRIGMAFVMNPFAVLALPYVLLGFYLDSRKEYSERRLKLHKLLFGRTAIWLIFASILLFFVIRNLAQFNLI